MTPETINDYALVPALATALVAVTSVVIYIAGSKRAWRTSLLGVAFAGILIAALPFMAVPILRRIFGAYPGYQWAAWGGYLLSLALYVVMLVTIIVEQRRGGATVPPVTPRKEIPMSDTNAVPAGNGTVVLLDDDGNTITADAETGEPTAKPTGKIVAVGIAGSVVTAAALVVSVAFLSTVPPEALAPLGVWALPVGAAVASLANFLSGYIKRP